jgi:hypothetical protein
MRPEKLSHTTAKPSMSKNPHQHPHPHEEDGTIGAGIKDDYILGATTPHQGA